MPSDVQANLVVAEALPTKVADDASIAKLRQRGDGYGATTVASIVNTLHLLAMEGSYFVATTPTPGTAVAYGSGGTQATFSDTAGFVVVQNTAAAGSGKKLYPHYLKILVSGTVPASATSTQFAVRIDTASRAPSANATALTTATGVTSGGITSTNLASAQPTVAVWVPAAGIPTIPASSSNARLVSRGSLRQTISVTLDEYILHFGGPDGPGATVGSTAGRLVGSAAPVCLNPQEFMVIHLWQPSGATNALSCELELAGWIR